MMEPENAEILLQLLFCKALNTLFDAWTVIDR